MMGEHCVVAGQAKTWFFFSFPRGKTGLAGRGLVDIMHPEVGPWPLSRLASPPKEGEKRWI